MYFNDVEQGGKTYFPKIKVTPLSNQSVGFWND